MEGVNKMGLFTEDLEKTYSDAKVPTTIVEGPVSPQTPTPSPPNDESSTEAVPVASESNNVLKQEAGQEEEEDDDDDLFKGN